MATFGVDKASERVNSLPEISGMPSVVKYAGLISLYCEFMSVSGPAVNPSTDTSLPQLSPPRRFHFHEGFNLLPRFRLAVGQGFHLSRMLPARFLLPLPLSRLLDLVRPFQQLTKRQTGRLHSRLARNAREQALFEFHACGRVALCKAAQEAVTFLARELSHQRAEVRLDFLRQLRTYLGCYRDKIGRNVELIYKSLQGRGQLPEPGRDWRIQVL